MRSLWPEARCAAPGDSMRYLVLVLASQLAGVSDWLLSEGTDQWWLTRKGAGVVFHPVNVALFEHSRVLWRERRMGRGDRSKRCGLFSADDEGREWEAAVAVDGHFVTTTRGSMSFLIFLEKSAHGPFPHRYISIDRG